MLNSSVANSLKSSGNKSLMNGEKFLSKTQLSLTVAATPLISIWQNTLYTTIHLLLGSAFNSLSSFSHTSAQRQSFS